MTKQFEAPGKGPWELETAHFPRPLSAFMQEPLVNGFIRGFTDTMARYGTLLDHMHPAVVNGWTYQQPRAYLAPAGAMGPPPAPVLWLLTRLHPKMRARIAVGKKAIDTKQWRRDLEQWDTVDKPAAIAKHRAIQSVDVAALDDAALAEHLLRVETHVNEMIALHHKHTATVIVPNGDYIAGGQEWTGASVGELLELVGGTSPISLGFAADELDTAGSAIRASKAAMKALHKDRDPAQILLALQADESAGPAVSAYIDAVQYRSVGYDVGDPTAGEMPEQLVATLKQAATEEIGRRKPADPTAIRNRVPAEHRVDFDERLAELQFINRLRDERGQYSDGWGTGLARRAILEAGKRLEQRELLNSALHAPDLTCDELRSLLLTGEGPSVVDVEARYLYRTTAKIEDVPAFLNAMPSPPPPAHLLPKDARRLAIAVDAMISNLFVPSDKPNEATVLRGLPVSPGTYVGTARIVDSPADFGKIQQGDILVTRATSPYFNVILPLLGAIVTDRGGQLCHAAIVAREFGIPAVVGTREATAKITDGATIEVDSVSGEVRIQASELVK
ncbi:PEP-utilizing enzyme [Smaragdicoccus niigatensis]|uniref:PEP-utilizing enzyme n=1 Tax=Smaragdicoccus niigatensis TaxID=359359 RepID=UPI000B263402|nr:PEP-utilizing enzyme [Smaragdicoccus niigatensis]